MRRISRRDALKLMGMTAAGGLLVSCAPAAATPAADAAPAAQEPAAAAEEPAAAAEEPAEEAAEPAPAEETVAEPGAATQDEIEITVSLWDIQNSFPDGEPDEIAKLVTEKFNVKLTPVNVGWGDAAEKYNTWAASGQLPDIIGAVAMPGTAQYYQWIGDGVVRALPTDFSAFPNIAQLMGQTSVTDFAVEGQNYFLPRNMYSDPAYWAMDRGLIARKDWMEKLGLAEPTNEEEFINLVKEMAKSDPDGNGQADTAGYTSIDTGFLLSQTWTGYGYTDGSWMKEEDGKYRQAIAGPKAFRLMQYLKKMYQAGGLDPDFATLESNQALEKFAAGKVGVLGRQISPKHLKAVMDAWVLVQKDKDFIESITFLHSPVVDGGHTRFEIASYWSESYFSVSVDDAKMDRILQLYEWLYSKEGLYMMMFGFEGKDYEVEDGNIKLLTPINEETGLHKPTLEIYPFTYAMNYLACWGGDIIQYDDPTIPQPIRDMTRTERDIRTKEWKNPGINWAVQAIDVPEKQEMAAILFADDWTNFIMDSSGKTDEDLYAAMQKNWDANGYAAAIEAVSAKAAEMGL